ncbi:tyrosine-type recombinase/integrase [Ruminococcaceae bacterium OttesenSCG-928-D13]|nr:tyrosine-type recombinase/integrase [Ruminococcaceae bacterium OttesenSCG-928-D13]
MLPYEIDDFMTHCEYKCLSVKTISSYEQSLRLFATYMDLEQKVTRAKDVTDKHITGYVAYIQERGKYTVACDERKTTSNYPSHRRDYKDRVTPTTINNYLRNLRVFFNYMVEERRARTCPVQRKHFLKAPRKAQEYLSDEGFARLMRCIDDSQFSEYRDKTVINLLLDTGMRIGECLATKIGNLDMNRRSIFLPASITKGKADRFVFFSDEMARQLRRWLQYKDRYINCDYLFPTKSSRPMQVCNFEKNMNKYCNRARISNVRPHTLRNNFAKRFLLNGGDIYTLSRLLGHSSVTVTEQAYLDITSDDLREKYQMYSPLQSMKVAR